MGTLLDGGTSAKEHIGLKKRISYVRILLSDMVMQKLVNSCFFYLNKILK